MGMFPLDAWTTQTTVWEVSTHLNPKVDRPQFAATVAAAVPLQHYQIDPVHQPLGLKSTAAHHAVWAVNTEV